MKKVICDHCGVREGRTIAFEINRRRNQVGDPEYQFEYVDICFQCLIDRVEQFIRNEPLEVKTGIIELLINDHKKIA